MGAWIEISVQPYLSILAPSLPVWERGLKYIFFAGGRNGEASLPVWERGLKSWTYDVPFEHEVAPRVGAWIEIYMEMYVA